MKGPPPAIGWKSEILKEAKKNNGASALLAGPNSGNTAACASSTPRRGSRGHPQRPSLSKDWPCDKASQSAAARAALRGANANKKGSKSLPNSPIKRHLNANNWPRLDPPEYAEVAKYNNGPMKRAISFPNTRDDALLPQGKKGDRKTRYHKGNMYVEIEDDVAVEKETVL